MRLFTDLKGDSWIVSVDVMSMARVEEIAKVDLLDVINPKRTITGLQRITALHAICLPQCESRGVSLDDFAQRLGRADICSEAMYAMEQAIVDFYPPSTAAPTLTLMERSRTVFDRKVNQILTGAVEAVQAVTDEQLETAINGLLNPPSGSVSGSEENSESTHNR